MRKDLLRQIRSYRKKLDNSIKKYGLNSNETRKISNVMDKLINEYYSAIEIVEFPIWSNSSMFYKKSYEALKNVTQQLQRFPSVKEWNEFAKENNYLSHVSLEYISKLNWKYLEVKIKRELNLNI